MPSPANQAAWDLYYLRMAQLTATKSKCRRAQYGAVIVAVDNRIVAHGFNGKPRGSSNDDTCYRLGLPDNAAKPNCCLHSESSAIIFSSPAEREGGTMYVSGVPCTDCALLIAQAGIARLVYLDGDSHGHRGNFDLEFYTKYGMKFAVVPVHPDALVDEL